MNLSYQRALWAAYTILDMVYDENEYHKLRFILSEMNPFIFENRTCSDPALWQSWTECCSATNSSGFLTFEQVMPVLVNFLKVNETEYSCFEEWGGAYSAEDVMSGISAYVKNGRWQEILNKVYNFAGF